LLSERAAFMAARVLTSASSSVQTPVVAIT
jgi:hypothetical protein